jgi:STE24 endopeptidase
MSSHLSLLKAHLGRLETLLDDDSIPWMSIIQGLLFAVLSFEVFVSLRQLKTYAYPAPPPQLKSHIDQETFEKSRDYGKDKLQFSLFTLFYEYALSAILIKGFAYARIWQAAGILMTKVGFQHDSEIPHSLFFLVLSQILTSIPSLPLSLYRHFVLEEKHGFNNLFHRWSQGVGRGASSGYTLDGCLDQVDSLGWRRICR